MRPSSASSRNTSILNLVEDAAEPEAIESGHLAAAVEWLRTWEVDYKISVAGDRPGTRQAEDWLTERGYEPGLRGRRYVHFWPEKCVFRPGPVEIRDLQPLETEGMSHIFADSFKLPNLATVLMIGLPRWRAGAVTPATSTAVRVACGSMRIEKKVAMLGLDATLPEFRGRSCQSALITRRLVDATRTGCEVVAAEVWGNHPASAAAAEVLEHIGFEEIAGRTNWQRPTGIA